MNENDSANKVHDHKVQDGAGKEKISKGSLWGDALEIRFVLWVDLYSQANRQDEAPHTRDEARQERVEGEGPHEETITELQRPGQKYVQEIGVQQLQALRRGAQVLFQETRNYRHYRRRHVPRTRGCLSLFRLTP